MKIKDHDFSKDHRVAKHRQLPLNPAKIKAFKTGLEDLVSEVKLIASGTNLANAKPVPSKSNAKVVP